MMASRHTKSVRKIVFRHDTLWREDLGLSWQAKFLPIRAQIIRKIEHICQLIFLVKQNPNVITANAVAVEQHRVHSHRPQFFSPLESGGKIRLSYLACVDRKS